MQSKRKFNTGSAATATSRHKKVLPSATKTAAMTSSADKNSRAGKEAEDNFADIFPGPVHIHKLVDTRAARSLVAAQPSDRIVTYRGSTWYAEVKATDNVDRFEFKSALRPNQHAAAAGVLHSGGDYVVHVYSVHLTRWFHIHYRDIRTWLGKGKASIKWVDLEAHDKYGAILGWQI